MSKEDIKIYWLIVMMVLIAFSDFSVSEEHKPYKTPHISEGGFIYDYLLLPLSSNLAMSGSYFTATDGMRDFH